MAGILKVDKYQDFNGNDIITSDGSGNITINNAALKNIPAFKVTLSGDQTLADDTLTRVAWDTEEYDTDNGFNTSTYQYTIPTGEGGKYFFEYHVFVDDLDDTDFALAYIETDGVQEVGTIDQRYGSSGTQNTPLSWSGVFTVTAGQTIEVVTKHGIGSNQEIRSNSSFFAGFKLIGL